MVMLIILAILSESKIPVSKKYGIYFFISPDKYHINNEYSQ